MCAALQPTDWAFSGHRNHAHYLAKGGNLKAMIAEIYGKATGFETMVGWLFLQNPSRLAQLLAELEDAYR